MLDPLGEEILGQHLLVGGQVRRLIGGQDLVWKQELILLLVTFMLHDMHNISSVNLREEKYVDIQVDFSNVGLLSLYYHQRLEN